MNLKVGNLEVGKEYTYKQLCELLGVVEKKGGAKKSQIEKWWDWFEWEKVTTQKFKITLIRDVPLERIDGRVNNGGLRAKAGRKRVLEEEFDFLFRSFLEFKFNQNFQLISEPIRFTRSEIAKYFGVMPTDYYERQENESSDALAEVTSRVSSRIEGLIINKINRFDGIEFGRGCLGYASSKPRDGVPCDELLPFWEEYSRDYMDYYHFANLASVASRGKWVEMEEYIAKTVGEYFRISRVYKVCISLSALPEAIDHDEWEQRMDECRKAFNDYVVEGIKKSFDGRRDKWLKEQSGTALSPEELAEWEELFGPFEFEEEDEYEQCLREEGETKVKKEYVEEAKALTERLVRIRDEELPF